MSRSEIEEALAGLSREELLALQRRIETLLKAKGPGEGAQRSREGMLKGIAAAGFDLDSAITEARTEWQRRIEDLP